jgi:CAAD domains of cyanobacterial aminoacyl-tRNA synthetase
METQQFSQSDYIDPATSTEAAITPALAAETRPMLPPANNYMQAQEIGNKVSEFFAELPEYLGRFFNTYKQPLITLGIIFGVIVVLKILFAVIDALNDIPLLYPSLEIVGIGYTIWFVNRYLLKVSTRQELAEEISGFKQQFLGE